MRKILVGFIGSLALMMAACGGGDKQDAQAQDAATGATDTSSNAYFGSDAATGDTDFDKSDGATGSTEIGNNGVSGAGEGQRY